MCVFFFLLFLYCFCVLMKLNFEYYFDAKLLYVVIK